MTPVAMMATRIAGNQDAFVVEAVAKAKLVACLIF